MKLARIWDKTDRKLQDNHYSQTYLGMFRALEKRFEIQDINSDCDAKDINADVILFYDIHSSHQIKIKGIENHPAIKYEYMEDPHQLEQKGKWRDSGLEFHKLGPVNRMKRAQERGIDFIICPYREMYYRYLAPYQWKQDLLCWFPATPNIDLFTARNFAWEKRDSDVLITGALVAPNEMYDFRKWASEQKDVVNKTNWQAPKGAKFPYFLAGFKAGLAACTFPTPKYFEIPLAGCVPFMQWNIDAYDLGFRHGKTCVYVDKTNFNAWIQGFKKNPDSFRHIAENAQKLVERNYTPQHFVSWLQNHIYFITGRRGAAGLTPNLSHPSAK